MELSQVYTATGLVHALAGALAAEGADTEVTGPRRLAVMLPDGSRYEVTVTQRRPPAIYTCYVCGEEAEAAGGLARHLEGAHDVPRDLAAWIVGGVR